MSTFADVVAASEMPAEAEAPEAEAVEGEAVEAEAQVDGAMDINDPVEHTVKIDGQEHTVSAAKVRKYLELEEEEPITPRMLKLFSKGMAADNRFRNAAGSRKQVEDVVERIKKNPMMLLEKMMGRQDMLDLMEQAIIERAKLEAMDPKEREQMERRKYLEKRAAQADEMEKRQKEHKLSEQSARYRQTLEKDFSAALQEAGVPVNQRTMRRMAEVAKAHYNARGKLPSPKRMAQHLKEQRSMELERSFADMDGDTLLEQLGPDAAKRIQKALGKKHKAQQRKTRKNTVQRKPKAEERLSTKDFFRRLKES